MCSFISSLIRVIPKSKRLATDVMKTMMTSPSATGAEIPQQQQQEQQ